MENVIDDSACTQKLFQLASRDEFDQIDEKTYENNFSYESKKTESDLMSLLELL